MTPSDLPDIFFGGRTLDDRRIPTFEVPRPNGFFLGNLEKSNFWGEILII